jgi:hypothetical protein
MADSLQGKVDKIPWSLPIDDCMSPLHLAVQILAVTSTDELVERKSDPEHHTGEFLEGTRGGRV